MALWVRWKGILQVMPGLAWRRGGVEDACRLDEEILVSLRCCKMRLHQDHNQITMHWGRRWCVKCDGHVGLSFSLSCVQLSLSRTSVSDGSCPSLPFLSSPSLISYRCFPFTPSTMQHPSTTKMATMHVYIPQRCAHNLHQRFPMQILQRN